jgi:hypothetical protein
LILIEGPLLKEASRRLPFQIDFFFFLGLARNGPCLIDDSHHRAASQEQKAQFQTQLYRVRGEA